MVEKTFVGTNFRFTYLGPIPLTAFLEFSDHWAREHHYHKEVKDHIERQTPKGKEVRYSFEFWKHVNTQVIAIIRLTAYFTNVRDVVITHHGRKERVQHCTVLIEVDSLLEKHMAHAWENQPWFYFLRGVVDRFWSKNLYEQHEGPLASDTKKFYDALRTYFRKEESLRAS